MRLNHRLFNKVAIIKTISLEELKTIKDLVTMALLLVGNSEIDEHVLREIRDAICLRHLLRSTHGIYIR